jgi:hypothetical protein
MKMVTNNAEVSINGKNTIFSEMLVKKTSDGATVVMIDGLPYIGEDLDINIEVHGDIESIILGSGSIKCNDITGGISTVSGDIFCNDVHGNITNTSGDINCEDVAGNVNTISGDVNCDDINGNVSTISGDIY